MKKTLIAFTILFSVIAAPVYATNMSYLNETPAKYYTDQDWEMLSQAQDKALNKAADNTRISWRNPATNHDGYFIPSQTTHVNGKTCRQLKTYLDANGISTMVHFRYCKVAGEWKLSLQD